jgi:hypothetical protein
MSHLIWRNNVPPLLPKTWITIVFVSMLSYLHEIAQPVPSIRLTRLLLPTNRTNIPTVALGVHMLQGK